jgi:hypothetical protein
MSVPSPERAAEEKAEGYGGEKGFGGPPSDESFNTGGDTPHVVLLDVMSGRFEAGGRTVGHTGNGFATGQVWEAFSLLMECRSCTVQFAGCIQTGLIDLILDVATGVRHRALRVPRGVDGSIGDVPGRITGVVQCGI